MSQPLRSCGLLVGAADACPEGDRIGASFAVTAAAGSMTAARAGEAAGARRAGAAGSADGSAVAAAAGGKGGGATSTGSAPGGAETWSGASEALCVPALTVSVFTSTGRIGSVEPMAMLGCATALVVARSVP